MNFEYYFKSDCLTVRVYDSNRIRINSTNLSSRFISNLKWKLQGVSIIDNKTICRKIRESITTFDNFYVVPDTSNKVGLSYLVVNNDDNKILYEVVIHIVDSELLLGLLD